MRPSPEVSGASGTAAGAQSPADGAAAGTDRPEENAALRHLQQVHAPVLLSFLTRLTRGDVHRAEDIVQETVLRAWRNPEARNAEGHWNRAWLFTVAKRILIDQMRSADVRPTELPVGYIDDHARPDDDIERLLDAREVRAALDSLPERLRITLVEIFFRERSVSEAADALDVPAGTVKSRTFYALRAMREALVSRGFDFGPAGQRRPTGNDEAVRGEPRNSPQP